MQRLMLKRILAEPLKRCPACAGLLVGSVRRRFVHADNTERLEESFDDSSDQVDDPIGQDRITLRDSVVNKVSENFISRDFVQFPAPRMEENIKGPKKLHLKRRTNVEVLALFDACVASGNIPRSYSLLKQIRTQTDDMTTTRATNRLMKYLVEEIPVSQNIEVVEAHFEELPSRWKIQPDRTSHALMCKAALYLKDEQLRKTQISNVVASWLSRHGDFGEVLSILDVLSPAEAQQIFDISGLDYRMIGKKFREELATIDHPLSRIAEVVPTAQKGVGLKLVKHSLGALTDINLDLHVDKDDYHLGGQDLAFDLARQRLLEENAVDAAVLRWRHEHEDMKKRGGLSYKKSLNAMFWEWKEQILPLIQEELERVDHKATDTSRPQNRESGREYKNKRPEIAPEISRLSEIEADYQVLTDNLNSPDAQRARRDYGPFLGLLKPEKMAAVAILELVRSLTTESIDGLKTALVAVKIGKAIENEYHSEVLKKRGSQELFQKSYREAVQSKKMFSMSVRQARANAIKRQDTGLFTPEWTQNVRARLGALMLSFIMYAGRIPMTHTDKTGKVHVQEAPAFYHSYQYNKGQKLGVVKCNEQLTMRLSSEPLKGSIYPRLLPMLVPPRPWYSWNSGGYLYTKTTAMRAKNCPEQTKYLKSASDRGLLDDVLTGLDVLGHTPWKINARVFECALEGWNSGEAIADIPPAETEIDLPDPPAHDADPAEKFAYLEKIREASAVMRKFASMRSDINYKLEIARAFLNDKMYFPHSLDFRGRAYPIPPHFNHLGNDLCRGLLKFGTERELGAAGLRWLKIHLANQCGFDKASFEEREAFADKNMERVFEANDHPMDGTRWWLAVDKPWQCLATCFELTAAMRCEDPEKFMSSMPVHQDGTCNGLQHYAALGGDTVGAKQVNLEPSERPQDVYRGVADIVTVEVDRDASEGNAQARLLQGYISRKLVKQTVMTNVYGVTWVGARLQIENQLKDLLVFKDANIFELASYVVNKVFQALKSMFTGAHEIQEWLRQSAQIVTRSIHLDALLGDVQDPMTSVIWTSPLDLPIVQPYRKEVRRQVYTNLQTVFLSDPADASEVNSKKQSSAFPPNYIHSLDATHMLMSALICREKNISFAAVHDSYWTHAADTDTMNVVLRDAFIKLHSKDLMAELEAEFRVRYKDHFSPNYSLVRTTPAYAFAIRTEHLKSGAVKVLPKHRGLVILDRELARKVLKFNMADQKVSQSEHEKENKDQNHTMDDLQDMSEESAATEETAAEESSNHEIKRHGRGLWAIWTPIDFPKLPKKGEFDVRRLRDSKYFFS